MAVPLSVLADEVNTSVRQVRRSLTALVAEGLLAVNRPAQADGCYAPKVYRCTTGEPAGQMTIPGVLSRGCRQAVTRQRRTVI